MLIRSTVAVVILTLYLALPLHASASPEKGSALKQRLEQQISAYGSIQRIEIDTDLGTPALLAGVLSKPSRHTPEWITYDFFREVKAHYGIIHPLRELMIKETKEGTDGTIVKLQQLLFGTPVYGGVLEVQVDRKGIVRRVEGKIYPDLEQKLQYRATYPAVTPKEAIRIAKASYRGDGKLSAKPQVTRYYLPTRPDTPLVYEIILEFEGGQSPYRIIIHAVQGSILT